MPGTARAALGHRDFRIVWSGTFASNIGTWMQNVVLGAYAFELTRSPSYVSLVAFAQLGPMLVLSIVGGVLADSVDRRRLLVTAQVEQALASVVLALLVLGGDPSRLALFLAVLAVGIGNAMNAPAYQATMPTLVDRENLTGAVALNSTQLNASRVVGPAMGGLLFPAIGAAGVFCVNAATYLFAIAGLLVVRLPVRIADPDSPKGFRRLVAGLSVARHDPLIRRVLLTLFTFSLLCLPFIGQLPTIAAENLGIRPKSTAYGLLYACLGLGGVTGAVSVGTVFASYVKPRIVRNGFACFAVTLAVLALLRSGPLAYPVITVLGFCYFASMTSLQTVLQTHLDDRVRGRVMALWLMGFGGTVPLGLLLAGPIAEATSITFVVLYGAVAAVGLSIFVALKLVPLASDH